MKITLEEAKRIYGNNTTEKEEITLKEFNRMLPKECRKCTLLEKDLVKVKAKCLYRTKERCMLNGTYSR